MLTFETCSYVFMVGFFVHVSRHSPNQAINETGSLPSGSAIAGIVSPDQNTQPTSGSVERFFFHYMLTFETCSLSFHYIFMVAFFVHFYRQSQIQTKNKRNTRASGTATVSTVPALSSASTKNKSTSKTGQKLQSQIVSSKSKAVNQNTTNRSTSASSGRYFYQFMLTFGTFSYLWCFWFIFPDIHKYQMILIQAKVVVSLPTQIIKHRQHHLEGIFNSQCWYLNVILIFKVFLFIILDLPLLKPIAQT